MIWLFFTLMMICAVVLIWVSLELRETQQTLFAVDEERNKAEDEVARLDRQMSVVLLNISPLIEKTDWMTGRWGGQFQTLVEMENQRNVAVEKVRKALMDTPSVSHLVATNPKSVIPVMPALGAPQ